ncbi:MAG: HIT domain-containing protein [Candidatus Saccharimonadales bacterium]
MNESKDTPPTTVYLPNARQADQRAAMESIAERGICFMCPEHIPEFYGEKDDIIAEGEHSFLVHNGYPYENTDYHIMAIPKLHATSIQELSDEFLTEAFGYFKDLEQKFAIKGGAIAMRFGDPSETGATVHHLHIHFIVPAQGVDFSQKPLLFHITPRRQ